MPELDIFNNLLSARVLTALYAIHRISRPQALLYLMPSPSMAKKEASIKILTCTEKSSKSSY